MAMRKATMKEQVAAAIAQTAPGDRPWVTIATVSGPTPWLTNGVLGLIGQFMVRYYFITVTDQAVVFHRLHRFTQRPKEVLHAIPRNQFPGLSGEAHLNPLWSVFHMTLPGDVRPTRFNVHRQWRQELEQMLPLLAPAFHQGAPAPVHAPAPAPGMPPQQPGHPPQMPPQPGPYQQGPYQQGPYQAPQPGPYQQGGPYPNQQGGPYQPGQGMPPQQPYGG